MTAITDIRDAHRKQATTSSSWTSASSRAQDFLRDLQLSFGRPGCRAHQVSPPWRDVQGHLGHEAEQREVPLPALKEEAARFFAGSADTTLCELRVLVEAGLVRREGIGKATVYRVAPGKETS